MAKLIGIAALLTAIEVLAEVLLHKWAQTRQIAFLFGGIVAYVALAVVFASVMVRNKLTVVNTLWQSFNIMSVGLVGTLILKESIGHRQKVGLVLAGLASLCMC